VNEVVAIELSSWQLLSLKYFGILLLLPSRQLQLLPALISYPQTHPQVISTPSSHSATGSAPPSVQQIVLEIVVQSTALPHNHSQTKATITHHDLKMDPSLAALLPKPNGFVSSKDNNKPLTSADFAASGGANKISTAEVNMRKKAAMNLAMGPGKQMGMNMFMMYMSGKSLTIWTMNMLSSLLTGPITALSNVTKTFKKFESEGVDLTKEKLVFLGLNLVGLGMGLYKMNQMGLLPMTSADWVSSVVTKSSREIAGKVL